MAMGWLGRDALDAEEEANALAELRMNRRRLRDEQDPFALPEVKFRNLFRVSRELARDIANELRPILQRDRASGLSVESQVLCAIRFYAVGSYQRAVGQDFMVAISQTGVQFPATQDERAAAHRKFERAPQPFAGAIGAIDCTYVAIVAPTLNEEVYVNHHGFHSLNVQMVCDPDLRILNADARFPGSRHDAAIWMLSPVRALMEEWYRAGERGTWLLGDSGYPLEPWIMTPILNAAVGTPEFAYTTAHCKARSVIERCYGVLKKTWRCLLSERVLMYGPEYAAKMVNACATLHNMRIHYRLVDEVEVDVVGPGQVQEPEEHLEARERLAEARRIRDGIVRSQFA